MLYKYDLFYKPEFLHNLAKDYPNKGLDSIMNLHQFVVFQSAQSLTKVEQHLYARHYVEQMLNTLTASTFIVDLSIATKLKYINDLKGNNVITLKRDSKLKEIPLDNAFQVEQTPLIGYMRMYVYRNKITRVVEAYEIDISFPSPPFMKTNTPEDDERLFYTMNTKGQYQKNQGDLKRVPYILKLYEPLLQAFYRYCAADSEEASGNAIYPNDALVTNSLLKMSQLLYASEDRKNIEESLNNWVKEHNTQHG